MVTENNIDLSIVIPTLGRSIQVDALLNSITKMEKTGWSIEVIIVDQNNSKLLDEIVIKYNSLLFIRHINVDFKGLSKAKNFGANLANGTWICFPDDDCEFFTNTLQKVNELICKSQPDVLFGKCVDRDGLDSVKKFSKSQNFLNLNNFEDSFIEATTFIRLVVFKQFTFDENMGVGSFFGSEEGYDWIYRILKSNKYIILYSPSLLFYHPQVMLDKKELSSLKRVYNYRLGTAFLCVKHQLYKKLISRVILCLCISILFTVILKRDKAIYYFLEFLTLIAGSILAKKTLNEH